MFLTRMFHGARRDDGVALAAVLGLMAVGLIITSVILTSVVSGIGFTTSTRAGVQAQAAAEAGVAAARAGLNAGTCSEASGAPVYTSATGASPRYSASIWRPAASGGWEARCPSGTATQVRIVSTGYAQNAGVGQSDNDTEVLEAVLSGATASSSLSASGAAIYSYSSRSLDSTGRLLGVDGTLPSVFVKTGNVTCSGDSSGAVNFVVAGGSLAITGSCRIAGDAIVPAGGMTLSGSGRVDGNVVATGVTISGGFVGGRIWTPSSITTSGNPTVVGMIKAKDLFLGGGVFNGGGYIYGVTKVTNAGATTLNATIVTQEASKVPDTWASKSQLVIQNPIVSPTFASDLPATPTVPEWVDFGATPNDSTASGWPGFTLVTMGKSCGSAQFLATINALPNVPVLLDARACSGTLALSGNSNAVIKKDLAILAKKMQITGSGRFSSTTGAKLWLLNTDVTADKKPTCQSGNEIVVNGSDDKFTGLTTMIYSPCYVLLDNGVKMKGQIYAGQVDMSANAELSYVPVGIPGYNFDSGATSGGGPASPRVLLSLRNVAG